MISLVYESGVLSMNLKKSRFFSVFAGQHYKMERFTATVLVLVMLLGLMVGLGFRDQHNAKKIVLGAAAKYTTETMFSLSRDVFTVVDVYRSSDYTKAFVLLKTTSMRNLPLEADKYQMFMTSGDSSKPLTGSPVGGIYIFGNTGYIGLSFIDQLAFQPNLYNIVLRNFDMIVPGDVETARKNYKESSYIKYNQLPLTVNLAGTSAKVVPFLNADSFTLDDIYMQLIGEQSISGLRSRTSATLLSMSSTMQSVNNAVEKLRGRNIVVPELPHQIANDRITVNVDETMDNPIEFDESMIAYAETGSLYSIDSNIPRLSETEAMMVAGAEDGSIDLTSLDSRVFSDDVMRFTQNDILYLVTDYVFPSGVQFNYQDVNLSTALLDSVKDPSVKYSSWVSLKASEATRYEDEFKLKTYTWKYTTGNAVPTLDTYSTTAEQDDWAIINEYVSAVARLFELKRSYQTELLYGYLTVSNAGRDISSIFSVNATSNTLLLY